MEFVLGRPVVKLGRRARLADLAAAVLVFVFTYGLVVLARHLWSQAGSEAEISHRASALPLYALYSLLRIGVSYLVSLVFAVAYGYVAAKSAKAEQFLIPLLDILQSIPVLSFLPGVMLLMIALFPHRQIGVELGSLLLIFTGQAWNMAFSFYSSMKAIPKELKECAESFRFNAWQRFLQLELPFGAIGLIWNSIVSVAGAWFFLMVCEMFVLGKRDFRLPGLGSYLQTAAEDGDVHAMLLGVLAIIVVVVLTDWLVWRPLIRWSDKFKFEQVENADHPPGNPWSLLARARLFLPVQKIVLRTAQELDNKLCRTQIMPETARQQTARTWGGRGFLLVLAVAGAIAIVHGISLLAGIPRAEYHELLLGAGATFLRVNGSLLIAALWTLPVGVAVGFNPKLARLVQPLTQIAASVPATALFPILLIALIKLGGGLGIASVVLMLMGTQWYVLFNVIAGAMAIPSELREVANLYRFGKWARWQYVILPGIFPYLITGLVTASGGAWNASIVAEYFHLHGKIFMTRGLGAQISAASDAGRSDLLLCATVLMAAIVVVTNRLVWKKLYYLGETRFKLET